MRERLANSSHREPFSHLPQLESLSSRERQVLELASLGFTNGEAGTQLGITVHAVKFHLANIYRKLGVANRTEAAVTYLRYRDAPRQAPS